MFFDIPCGFVWCVEFAKEYQSVQAETARDSHLLQSFFGMQCAGAAGPGIIEHYTADG
jgi:hypothetical protein